MGENVLLSFSNELVSGNLYEIKPNIYAVVVKDDYDRAMLFCRYQEFYESPFEEIKGKYFSLEYFMRLYKQKRKSNVFTYPKDWAGYNLPSQIIENARAVFCNDTDGYNLMMNDIHAAVLNHRIKMGIESDKYYLIGTDNLKSSVLKHEVAHGFYYTKQEYKTEVDSVVRTIPIKDYKYLKKKLISYGYADDDVIIYDEIQAFLSTERTERALKFLHLPQHNVLKKIFKKHYNIGVKE
jgi:hypothetical protein